MKKFFIIFVLSLLLSVNAKAYTVVGTTPCGEILSRQNEKLTEESVIFYVSGYITGRNAESSGIVGRGVDYDSIFWATIKYCKDNPLNDTADAAKNIYLKLKNK